MAKKLNRKEFIKVYCELVGITSEPKQDKLSGKNIYFFEGDKFAQIEFIPATDKYFYTIYIKQDFDIDKITFDKLVDYLKSLTLEKLISLNCIDFFTVI